MTLHVRVLLSRLRRTGVVVLLRLAGLTLAALLAAAVPAFVSASMEQVMHSQLQAAPDTLTLVLSWTASDAADHSAAVSQLDDYLRHRLPGGAGLVTIPSTAQGPVQALGSDGKVKPARKYFKLAVLPPGTTLVTGRLPGDGAPEVVIADGAMARAGYSLGDRLRVPLAGGGSGPAPSTTVTIVGTVGFSDGGALAPLQSALDGALLTGGGYWQSLGTAPGEALWALRLPGEQLHTATLPALAAAVRELPLRAGRILPSVEITATPQTWLDGFLAQMAAARQLLLVLLVPIFLLVLFFVVATADAVVSSRRVEVAVLRSRGAGRLSVMAYYLSESLLLVAGATALAVALTVPAVKLMGLCAGFLKLVDRPSLPVALTGTTVLYAAGAGVLAELISLAPLSRVARFTVATMNQAEAAGSPVLAALRVVGELAVLVVLGYGTWRLRAGAPGAGGDPLFLALPALALTGAGLVLWRVLAAALSLLGRLLADRLSPPLYLALSLLKNQSGRYRALWLMLMVTTGLGIYGAAFARTLDRDLVARAQYRTGSDLLLRPAWESEVVSYDPEGNPSAILYREPPYSQFQGLPGVTATARVQTRADVNLLAGTRNLGKATLMAIQPQEFGRTARFLPELSRVQPAEYLGALAGDERAALLSAPLAQRLGVRPGDQLKLKTRQSEAAVVVAGIVPFWPGRMPEDGDFIVGNVDYLQEQLGLEPYDIWVRLAPAAPPAANLVAALHERGARLLDLLDQRAVIAAQRREPLRLGLYATLSVGFVTALAVTALSYLLSVGRTLQARAKELGVLQAMGLSSAQVAVSLYAEQLLVVGTAAAAGLAAGGWASQLYVPALRQQPGQSLLPLHTASTAGDGLYLLLGFALALVAGAATVAVSLRRLAIGKALRLGEDG